MRAKKVQCREYNPESHGNIFDFIVEESERIRYWGGKVERDLPPRPAWRSLDRDNPHGPASLLKLQEPGSDDARKDVFEIAQARKL